MNPLRYLFIILMLALLAGCSTDSEPEPEPQNIFFDVRGESFPYDVPEDVRIIASHPDGFSDASIDVYVNDDLLFRRDEQSIGTPLDTTFTPQAQGPGQLWVESFRAYELRAIKYSIYNT